MYGQTAKGEAAAGAGGGGEIGTKARSTAEEFSRIAAEKTEASAEEGVKETLWKRANDAVASAKDKLSEAAGKEKP
uniref:Uncharacterized protein n=1 Tax=Nymphaea colorata TaxID=210225 RepID=A0A5K1BAJ8_9MAGN